LVTTEKEAATPSPDSMDGLATALRAVSHRYRLQILRLLDSTEMGITELARSLDITNAQVRRHVQELMETGLVGSRSWDDGPRYSLDRRAAALLNASIVSLLGRASAEPAPLPPPQETDEADILTMVAPAPPERCTECQNSTFVRGLLDDLDRVLGEARDYDTRLRHLATQVLTAHEGERKRIARELHDDTAQALTSVLVRLRLLERSVDDELQSSVQELRHLTGEALGSVRRMALDLRPAALDDLGLPAALRSYVEKFSENWSIAVQFSSDGLKRRLPADVELVFYRVIQEALSNVAKHSGARSVKVALARKKNIVTACIEDDGCGFNVEATMASRQKGLGLFGMKERLALVDGTLRMTSSRAGGTTVIALVPLSPRA
jgi:signal transduction histidine kinase